MQLRASIRAEAWGQDGRPTSPSPLSQCPGLPEPTADVAHLPSRVQILEAPNSASLPRAVEDPAAQPTAPAVIQDGRRGSVVLGCGPALESTAPLTVSPDGRAPAQKGSDPRSNWEASGAPSAAAAAFPPSDHVASQDGCQRSPAGLQTSGLHPPPALLSWPAGHLPPGPDCGLLPPDPTSTGVRDATAALPAVPQLDDSSGRRSEYRGPEPPTSRFTLQPVGPLAPDLSLPPRGPRLVWTSPSWSSSSSWSSAPHVPTTIILAGPMGSPLQSGTLPALHTCGQGPQFHPLPSPDLDCAHAPTDIPAVLGLSLTAPSSGSMCENRPATLLDIRQLVQLLPTRADMTSFARQIVEECKLEFTQFRAELSSLSTRVDTLTQERVADNATIANIQSTIQQHSAQLFILQQHLNDIENRNRRNNLRVRGLPESIPASDLFSTLSTILILY
ncbi:uncharacterized protein LOC142749855 [Rhinoderma darwinii]|uniref:uncharacterized protein LOC142749855 n=1 Tax=Rhinoderma darwinii TaxID=43563 RepID=UPI003F66FA7E